MVEGDDVFYFGDAEDDEVTKAAGRQSSVRVCRSERG